MSDLPSPSKSARTLAVVPSADGAEQLPSASHALTVYLYVVEGATLPSRKFVVALVPICEPLRKILYCVTAMLSVEAVHARLIALSLTRVTVRPAGTVGACVSAAPLPRFRKPIPPGP